MYVGFALRADDAGYAGAWFWSVQAGDDASDYKAGIAALDRFTRVGAASGSWSAAR